MQALSFALRGLSAAASRLESSAWRTARAGDPAAEPDLVKETIEQIGAKHEFSANLRVLQISDEMTKQLLDIRA